MVVSVFGICALQMTSQNTKCRDASQPPTRFVHDRFANGLFAWNKRKDHW